MRSMQYLTALALFAGLSGPALAQSVTGTWKTIDDETGQAKALVQITENANGELSGRITKLFNKPDMLCDKCEGERKNKPVIGMNILWGLKKTNDGWGNGKILDPKNGKTYSAKARLIDNGTKLEVRGYLGVSLLGRTQTWERQ